jgi:hypothetical protein
MTYAFGPTRFKILKGPALRACNLDADPGGRRSGRIQIIT